MAWCGKCFRMWGRCDASDETCRRHAMEMLHIVTKAGGCRSGSDIGGSVWHYVRQPENLSRIVQFPWNPAGTTFPALCGDAPVIQWSSHQPEGRKVTCKKCLKIHQKQLPT